MTPQTLAIVTPEYAGPERRKGGRPKKRNTSVVSVRIPDHIYDAYIKTALRSDMDVRTVLRQVLTLYAPKP